MVEFDSMVSGRGLPTTSKRSSRLLHLFALIKHTTASIIMASRKTAGRRTRPQRATSNIFAMFDQAQIQEFKEAFNMIDQDRDGFITQQDLQDMFASLGKEVTEEFVDKMIGQAAGSINFTMFLTLFGEKLTGTDPQDVIKNAFQCFDEDNSGTIPEERFREIMTTMGERFTDEQVDELLRDAPIKDGKFDYVEFTRVLKHGTEQKD
ncbi:putative myosin regulatory light chain [Aphelenchoides fujianensis]|nr:putative myosin regulatory light chain [Aphelenchoides fujianensis]